MIQKKPPMLSIKKPTISLLFESAAFLDARTSSGAHTSMSKVKRTEFQALQESVEPIERWLRDEVAPTYDKMKANPKRGVVASKVFADIRTRHAAQLKAKTP
jgi:antitoxin ParD1/3/4